MKSYTNHVSYWEKTYLPTSFHAAFRLVQRLKKIGRRPKWDPGYWYLGVSIRL